MTKLYERENTIEDLLEQQYLKKLESAQSSQYDGKSDMHLAKDIQSVRNSDLESNKLQRMRFKSRQKRKFGG